MSGLYIHIPYCRAKCAYCDFYSRRDDGRMAQLVEAIISEFKLRRHEIPDPITTVYFGGGTPSSLPLDLITRLVTGLGHLPDVTEFTFEVNPEDITAHNLRTWTSLGINRISMGVQSLNDDELRTVGRRHTAAEALAAIRCIRQAGIERISCDLIYGLPGQTLDSWRDSLSQLLDTGIGHLSAYSLSYEPGTLLHTRLQLGRITPVADEVVADMYNHLIETADRYGFEHYEISNFALPGQRSRHNSSYWHNVPYLGLGPSAHSFDGSVRRVNPYNTVEYLKHLPAYEAEDSSPTDRLNDLIITALRTSDGLPLDLIPEQHRPELLQAAQPWLDRGQLVMTSDGPGTLTIPQQHWLVSDAIMRDLLIE